MNFKVYILSVISGFFTMNTVAAVSSQSLFNGQNLSGWEHVGDGNFVVESGLLKTQGGMGLLWYTKKKMGNVTIHVVYKTTHSDSNSGVFVRIAEPPKTEWDAVHHGYEVQICDSGKDAFDDLHRTGAIYSYSKALQKVSKPAGEWNNLDITLKGQLIIVYLNGKLLNKFDASSNIILPRKYDFEPKRGPRPLEGYIGLQNHDHNATSKNSHVYFKEISVTPLNEITFGE
jgi:hypothetical protein